MNSFIVVHAMLPAMLVRMPSPKKSVPKASTNIDEAT
jgi:hypothetical protein